MEGGASRLHPVCQGGYVDMHEINLGGVEQKICRNCVDKLWMGGKPEKLKKVGHSTVYSIDKSQEYKEEVKGAVIGGGGEYVSIVPVVYPHGTVSVLSLGYFSSVGSSLNLLILLCLSLFENATFKSISRIRGRGN